MTTDLMAIISLHCAQVEHTTGTYAQGVWVTTEEAGTFEAGRIRGDTAGARWSKYRRGQLAASYGDGMAAGTYRGGEFDLALGSDCDTYDPGIFDNTGLGGVSQQIARTTGTSSTWAVSFGRNSLGKMQLWVRTILTPGELWPSSEL